MVLRELKWKITSDPLWLLAPMAYSLIRHRVDAKRRKIFAGIVHQHYRPLVLPMLGESSDIPIRRVSYLAQSQSRGHPIILGSADCDHQVFQRPQLIDDARSHRRSASLKRAVNPAEVVVRDVQRYRGREAFQLFREAQG